jgi:hypothetical protein
MSETTQPGPAALVDDTAGADGQSQFRNGNMLPVGVSLVKETTVFREFGPVAGSTMKLSHDTSPPWAARDLPTDAQFRRALHKRLVRTACSRSASRA